jgi:lipopolysaccharide transport system permease protein
MINSPSWQVLLIPLIIIWLALLSMGFGMVISALTTKYRDLRHLVTFGMGLWMYATPVVYPISEISGKLRWIMDINPVSAPIELFRYFAFGAGNPNIRSSMISLSICIVLLYIGLLLFHRSENTFIDVA